jgi:hypothetical protein
MENDSESPSLTRNEVPRSMFHVPRNQSQIAWVLKTSSQVLIVLAGRGNVKKK